MSTTPAIFVDFEDTDALRSALSNARKIVKKRNNADDVDIVGITITFLVDGKSLETTETIWSSDAEKFLRGRSKE